MEKRKTWMALSLAATLIIAGLIFFFSSQSGNASNAVSGRVTATQLSLFRRGYSELSGGARQWYLESWGTIIRKVAHFAEYAALGFFLLIFLHLKFWCKRPALAGAIALGISALYGASDEIHQLFVPERSASMTDVLIDSAGALAGILFALACFALLRWIQRRRGRSDSQ